MLCLWECILLDFCRNIYDAAIQSKFNQADINHYYGLLLRNKHIFVKTCFQHKVALLF